MPNGDASTVASDPRGRILMSDRDIVDHFYRLGFQVNYGQLCFSTEQIDDFRAAQRHWLRGGKVVRNEEGLIVLHDAQPVAGQPTRDIVVVSLGYARVIMGVLSKRNRAPYYRFAPTMD